MRDRETKQYTSQAAFIILVLISSFTHLDGEHLPDARGVFLESERDEAPYSPAEQAVVQKTQLRHRVPRRDKVRLRREARLLSPGEHVRAWLNIFEVLRFGVSPPVFFCGGKGKVGGWTYHFRQKLKRAWVKVVRAPAGRRDGTPVRREG